MFKSVQSAIFASLCVILMLFLGESASAKLIDNPESASGDFFSYELELSQENPREALYLQWEIDPDAMKTASGRRVYCHNDPVNHVDYLGLSPKSVTNAEMEDAWYYGITLEEFQSKLGINYNHSTNTLVNTRLNGSRLDFAATRKFWSNKQTEAYHSILDSGVSLQLPSDQSIKPKTKVKSNRSRTAIPFLGVTIDWTSGKEASVGFGSGIGRGANDLVGGIIWVAEENTNFYVRDNAYGYNGWSNAVFKYGENISSSSAQLTGVDPNSTGFKGFTQVGTIFTPTGGAATIFVKAGKYFIAYKTAKGGVELIETTADVARSWSAAASRVPNNAPRQTLIHFTDEAGEAGILNSQQLFASSGSKHARFGDGQYFTNIFPENIGGRRIADLTPEQIASGQQSLGQVSSDLFGIPWNTRKLSNYVEIDVTGLNVVNPRPGTYLIPNSESLDLTGRIIRSGKTVE